MEEIPMTYIVKDAMGKMAPKTYFTQYHAEQMVRALNINEASHYRMYYGSERFSMVAA